MIKTTKEHKKFWKDRKINWEHSYLNGVDEVSGRPMWNHPHRDIIIMALKSFNWISLWEVGVGAGANLMKIVKELPNNKQLGGSDINADAIEACRKVFVGGRFHVEPSEDILLSDNSVDVILSDAHLLYYGPKDVKKALKEMVRVARNQIVLCELHEPSLFRRLMLRFKTGYNAHDYKKELEELGCFDLKIVKIPRSYWQGDPWETYGYVISAQISK